MKVKTTGEKRYLLACFLKYVCITLNNIIYEREEKCQKFIKICAVKDKELKNKIIIFYNMNVH